MRTLLLALLLVMVVPLRAQRIDLAGMVVVQNSAFGTGQRQFVQGASVRSPGAKAVSSDAQGSFTLTFHGTASGMPVRLSVEKPGSDVVDPSGLERVMLGRATPLTVALCELEKMERTRLRFHGIATESITNRFEEKLSALRNTSVVRTGCSAVGPMG